MFICRPTRFVVRLCWSLFVQNIVSDKVRCSCYVYARGRGGGGGGVVRIYEDEQEFVVDKVEFLFWRQTIVVIFFWRNFWTQVHWESYGSVTFFCSPVQGSSLWPLTANPPPFDIWYDMIWYDMIWYDIHLLTAVGLTPGGSSTVHIYTQTIHRTTRWNQYTE